MPATKQKTKERVFPTTGFARPKDVAEFFTVSLSTAYRMMESGRLKVVDVTDTIVRTTWEEIHDYARRRERHVTE